MVAALSVVEQMAELVEELCSAKGQYICAFYGVVSRGHLIWMLTSSWLRCPELILEAGVSAGGFGERAAVESGMSLV